MKHFINQRDAIVTEAVQGLVRSSGGEGLALLDGLPDIRVVVRRDWDKSRVAVISGGGSGHEPAHAGFVGAGMLTAAVAGAIFASPSVDAILAGILAVTGQSGCLLIVKNYTGDRLNFGLAAEQARALGHEVEMVIVGDDVALEGHGSARGIAGTVFVHKAAGFLAEQGASLAEVAAFARDVAGRTRSLGLSLSDCDAFDPEHQSRLGDQEGELGLGIHGEPGARRIEAGTADALMALVADTLADADGDLSVPKAVMINNLGRVAEVEMLILAHSFAATRLGKATRLMVGPAPIMTALDMNGFSLSTVDLTPQIEEALLAPVGPRAWPGAVSCEPIKFLALPTLPDAFGAPPSDDPVLRAVIERVIAQLTASEDELNALDAAIGDGDAGSTFAGIARQVQSSAERLPLGDHAALMRCLGALLARHGGGSSGVLLSIMFAAAGGHDGNWKDALAEGLAAMQRYGGAEPGDRTMIDAIAPAIDALQTGSVQDAAKAARAGAERTRTMKAAAGRASYVPQERLNGAIDPGAEAIARALEAIAAL